MRLGLVSFFFRVGIIFVVVSGSGGEKAFAAGYKIPEQSASALALSAAYVAHAQGAAAAYYNPANMVYGDDGTQSELSLSFIRLPPLQFSGTVGGLQANAASRSESVLLPNIHFVFAQHKAYRFGTSLVFPFGLSKRWDAPFQKLIAEEFTLKTIELDVSAGFLVHETFSIGGGIRGIYSEGRVKSDGAPSPSSRLTRDLKGDAFSPGYYLALSFRPIKNVVMAATYRSEVTPDLEGHATLSTSGSSSGTYNGPASVEVVLPATAQLATAMTYHKAVFEFVYERTYWGRYKSLDFEYDSTLTHPVLIGAFDDPIEKNWSDSDTYRFGLSYQYRPAILLMFGFAIDKSPVPEETLNFDIPDADAHIFSAGFSHRPNDKVRIAAGYLYAKKERRSISNSGKGIDGEFKSSAHILNASIAYFF